MTIYDTPIKRPRIPRCLCRTFIDYILQIGSPSLFFSCEDEKARQYFDAMNKWKYESLAWLVQNRKANREQWKEFRKHEKRGRS